MQNDSGLTVTADKVLVLLMKVKEETQGGIILPSVTQAKEQMAQQLGTLIAVGSIAAKSPQLEGISLGDTVLVSRYAGQPFPVDGKNYFILRVTDVLGKADRLPDYVIRGAEASHTVFGTNLPDSLQNAA